MRLLVCNGCGGEVEVYEEPVEFVDPARFRCVPCLDPRHQPEQLELLAAAPAKRVESRPYDPALAAIPY